MKSTKYQLLKDDFDFVCKELKEYRLMIDKLRYENESLSAKFNYECYWRDQELFKLRRTIDKLKDTLNYIQTIASTIEDNEHVNKIFELSDRAQDY